jgi:hypothetical protein
VEAPEANAFLSNDPPPTIAAADAIVLNPPDPPPFGKASPATPLTSTPAFFPIVPIALPNNSCPTPADLIRLHFVIRLPLLILYQSLLYHQ